MIWLFSWVVLPALVASRSPQNPYLSSSAWPIAQHDNYAQASSGQNAISQYDVLTLDTLMDPATAGTLTVLYTSDNKVIWGRSSNGIFKVDRTGDSFRVIDVIKAPPAPNAASEDGFRGIYSFLTRDDRFYTSVGPSIFAYENEVLGNSFSNISYYASWTFPEARSDETILSVSLTYDGHVVFLTNQGVVGVHRLDLKGPALAWTRLGAEVEVTNSMAVDQFGGIYVVTSENLHRLWWDPMSLTLGVPSVRDQYNTACNDAEARRCYVYKSSYPIEDTPFEERPTRKGSGTTPSLMRNDRNGDIFCVIADGSRMQQVLVFDIKGRIAASLPVDFGTSSESYTEQSILISHNRLVVVQNAVTDTGRRLMNLMKNWNVEKIIQKTQLPNWIAKHYLLLPIALGDSPVGYQQMEFDFDTQTLSSRWIKSDSGCPNSIPTYSAATNLMYCVSRSVSIDDPSYPRSGFQGAWTVEALDWDTGLKAFSFPVGTDFRFNTLYAACQIGADKEIIFGTIGGLVRVGEAKRGRAPIVARRVGTNPWLWALSGIVGSSVRPGNERRRGRV